MTDELTSPSWGSRSSRNSYTVLAVRQLGCAHRLAQAGSRSEVYKLGAFQAAALAGAAAAAGAMLRIEGPSVVLKGLAGARIFRRGHEPVDARLVIGTALVIAGIAVVNLPLTRSR